MKQMRQPRKDVLREQLALAADEIIRLRTFLEIKDQTLAILLKKPDRPAPWWRRLLAWRR
jgi:hypothetical protein